MPKKIKTSDKSESKEPKKVSNEEAASRRALFEELFYDIYRNRTRVYWVNFFRGIFFGFGTVLGGTVLVAILVWILSQFVDWFPVIGDYIQQIINSMERSN